MKLPETFIVAEYLTAASNVAASVAIAAATTIATPSAPETSTHQTDGNLVQKEITPAADAQVATAITANEIDSYLAEEEKSAAVATTAHYSFRNAIDIAEMELPPVEIAWGGVELVGGNVAEIIGPPGLGKSRLMLSIAIDQIIGAPFPNADYAGTRRPLVWQFFGTENSIRRWQRDLRKMIASLSQEKKELLRTHLYLPTLEADGDTCMSLDDDANVAKCMTTLQLVNPDIIVFDPWGDLCADELKDDIQRDTVRKLKKIAICGRNKDVPIILLNHSRMGAKVYAGAINEGGNYGRNSKAIYGQCRNVFNLRPAYTEQERFGDAIEIIDMKHNDRAGFARVAVALNKETMKYELIPDFDHEEAQMEWEAASNEKRRNTPRTAEAVAAEEAAREERRKVAKASKAEETMRILDEALDEVFAEHPGYKDSKAFKARLIEKTKAPKAAVETYLENRVADWKSHIGGNLAIAEQQELMIDPKTREVKERSRHAGGKLFRGSPEAIAAYLRSFGMDVDAGKDVAPKAPQNK